MRRLLYKRHAELLGVALMLLGLAPVSRALDAVVLEVREMTLAGIPVEGASARLDVLSDRQTRLTLNARGATLPQPIGKLTNIALVCEAPVIAEPRYGCDGGQLSGRGGPTGSIDMRVAAEMRTDTGITTFSGKDLKVAGTAAKFDGQLDAKGWRVAGSTGETSVAALRKFASPWFQLPADVTGDGKAAMEGGASDSGNGTVVDATLRLDAVNLTNEASTIVTDKLSATAHLRAQFKDKDTALHVDLAGKQGQVLVGPVLFDFGKNALALSAQGIQRGDTLAVESLRLTQKDLIELTGGGSVNLAGEVPIIDGDFKLASFEFPAAYNT